MVVCSRSISGSSLLSRSMRRMVGGDVIELTLCIIWRSYVLVCCGVLWWSNIFPLAWYTCVQSLVLLCEVLVQLWYHIAIMVTGIITQKINTFSKLLLNSNLMEESASASLIIYESIIYLCKTVQEWFTYPYPSY